ncbi:MAG: 6-carboxyhexanoate--CoA ligase [Nitrospirota bacterium]
MRSSLNEEHISGAERLVDGEFVHVLPELMLQAVSANKIPDKIIISVDAIEPSSVIYTRSLDIKTIESSSPEDAAKLSADILNENGVSDAAIENAFYLLRTGPSPSGRNMRGAIIMDAAGGERMEPDSSRGVRVSRVDYSVDLRNALEERLRELGIFHRRVIDAIAIASKVADKNETIAELCWSDDTEYTTGYVASKKSGYVRMTNMKEKGNPIGGRVFFVNRQDLNLEEYIYYLEKQPVIIDRIGE